MLEQIVIISLTVWRISSLIYNEDGPWDVMRKIRSFFRIIHDDEGEPVAFPTLLSWMDCFWCVCLFVALLITTIWCIIRTDVLNTSPVLNASSAFMNWFVLWMGSATGSVITEWQLGRSRSRLF